MKIPSQPLRLYYVNFTIAFLCTGFLVGFLGGSLGSGGEAYDFHTPFIDEISGEAKVSKQVCFMGVYSICCWWWQL